MRSCLRSLVVLSLFCYGAAARAVPRRVRIQDQSFILAGDGSPIVLSGPNVVVKGPPYLPAVSGETHCHDMINSTCSATGTCTSCTTFNEADVALLKLQKRNFIRLGVVWAGAQPRDADELDAQFVQRLHALLNLTDREGIHVMLDNHGDMVGSAGCGNGVPMWLQQKAAPELIGKQLETGFPYSLVDSIRVEKLGGYDTCEGNASKWAAHAGDPNYNLLNECCLAMNGGNPAGLGYTTINQKTMSYIMDEGPGRTDFVRFWTLLAHEIQGHPSAFAIEPMNEPMSIYRRSMYDTWRAVAESVMQVIPDVSVAVCDTGQGPIIPDWATPILNLLPVWSPSWSTISWMKKSQNVFYAWHCYSGCSDTPQALAKSISNVQGVMHSWNVPSFATEFMGCDIWNATAAVNISHSYWHYSSYCTTGVDFGNRKVPTDTFGGCILGWGAGDEGRCT